MVRSITKDTVLCMSLAGRSSNIGTRFHNFLYAELSLDFVYKAFTTTDLAAAIAAAPGGQLRVPARLRAGPAARRAHEMRRSPISRSAVTPGASNRASASGTPKARPTSVATDSGIQPWSCCAACKAGRSAARPCG